MRVFEILYFTRIYGDSYVGDLKLVTFLFHVGNRISILATFWECWSRTLMKKRMPVIKMAKNANNNSTLSPTHIPLNIRH